MADLEIDLGAIYYGIRNVNLLISDLGTLSSALSAASFSDPEIPSASQLSSCKAQIDAYKTAAEDILLKLNNTKNILINNDREASLFFQFLETGVLDENFNFTEVPLYDQTKYKEWYHYGTIADGGCGLTSMAMALSYIYNDIITPDELLSGSKNGSSYMSRMESAGKSQGLLFSRENGGYTKEKTAETLSEGKLVIISVNNGGHFVLLTGVTDDGKFLVNDPYGPWQKDRPMSWNEINKSHGYVWVIDPYENVGNATTSIGKVTVSGDVQKAILKANESGETVGITDKTYLTNVQRSTAAQVAGDGAHIGPTALSLKNGGETTAASLRYSEDGSPINERAQTLGSTGLDNSHGSTTTNNTGPTTLASHNNNNTGNTTGTGDGTNTGATNTGSNNGNNNSGSNPTVLSNQNTGSQPEVVQTSSTPTQEPSPQVLTEVQSSPSDTPSPTTIQGRIETVSIDRIDGVPIKVENQPTTDATPTVEAPVTTVSTDRIDGVPVKVDSQPTPANTAASGDSGVRATYIGTKTNPQPVTLGSRQYDEPITNNIEISTNDIPIETTVETVVETPVVEVTTEVTTPKLSEAVTTQSSVVKSSTKEPLVYNKPPSINEGAKKNNMGVPMAAAALGVIGAAGIALASKKDKEEKEKRN